METLDASQQKSLVEVLRNKKTGITSKYSTSLVGIQSIMKNTLRRTDKHLPVLQADFKSMLETTKASEVMPITRNTQPLPVVNCAKVGNSRSRISGLTNYNLNGAINEHFGKRISGLLGRASISCGLLGIYSRTMEEARELFRKRQRKPLIEKMKELIYVAAKHKNCNAVSAGLFLAGFIEYFFKEYSSACEFLIYLVRQYTINNRGI